MVDFLGIGAQKAGTTWLAEMLSKHPSIQFPASKEVHFWDLHYHGGYEWYDRFFTPESGIKKGDITPAYAILPLKKIAEANRHYPNVPLIYSVRNPIDRAWSSALMALKRAEMKPEEASDQWFIDHFHSEGSTKRGDYEQCLKNWLQFYPQDQLLLVRYDDIAKHPRELIKKVALHIGVDSSFYDVLPDEVLTKRVFEGTKVFLRPSLRAALEEMYGPKTLRFEAYIKELRMIKR